MAVAHWSRIPGSMPIIVQRAWLVLACVFLYPGTAWPLDPSRRISQYAHAAWRVQDGFFRGSPYAVAQTADGYLWIGTDSGLVRFDGVRFLNWDASVDGQLPNAEVTQLLAARDGSLWIATFSGLSHWKDHRLTNYPVGAGGATAILEDHRGTIWFVRRFADADGRVVCQIAEAGPRCLGAADGVPAIGNVNAVLEDRQQNIWFGADTMLLRWSGQSHTEYRPSGLQNNSGISGVTGVAEAPDGTKWVGVSKSGPGLGLLRLVDGRLVPFTTPTFDGSALAITTLHVDRAGALWIGTIERGLFRVHAGQVDHFDEDSGLSGNLVTAVTEDREGSIWVTTSQGLDRFSDTPVVTTSPREGLCSPEAASVLATRDGSIWTGGDGALSRIRGSAISCLRSGRELPGAQVTSIFEDRRGRLWVGLDDGLWIYDQQRFTPVRRPDGKAIGLVTSITEDAMGQVWIAVSGPPRILMRIEGSTVRQDYADPPLPRRVAVDPSGGLWLGLLNGDLAQLRDGKATVYRFDHEEGALLHQIDPQPDGSVLAATSFGLIGVQNGNQIRLAASNGLPCDAVHAMAFDTSGNLWLLLSCGLTRLTAADLQRWKTDTGARFSLQLLDELDGVRMGRAAFASAARGTDGRLWFASGQHLQTVDPLRLRRNDVPPPVHIEQVIADRRAYAARGVIRLPPLTRDLEIDYVALSFIATPKVRFRYRLDGRDTDWQEPGSRRQAFYSDLRPGAYRFRVMASNSDGIWNTEGAAVDFVVAPAWYQTSLFLIISAITAALVIAGIYKLRMFQVARALTTRFDERLDERMRVARDIHDTLLQTVQGSKLVADNALARPDDVERMRQAMVQVSAWLERAATEGRAAIHRLRASTIESGDLSAALQRAIDDCTRLGTISGQLTADGAERELLSVVQDEIYRIAYEAIHNTCAHSKAERMQVSLAFGRDLTLSVTDNGVGIDPAVLQHGRPGHIGLQAMRERAARIGAALTITSKPGKTEVVLTAPGRIVFSRRWR